MQQTTTRIPLWPLATQPGTTNGPVKTHDLLREFASHDKGLFTEMREQDRTLATLSPDIDTYQKLESHYQQLLQEPSPTKPDVDLKKEITDNLASVGWHAPIGMVLGGAVGWAAGWALGGVLGACINEITKIPLAFTLGDYASSAGAVLGGYVFVKNVWPNDSKINEDTYNRYAKFAPIMALTTGMTFFLTRPTYEVWCSSPEKIWAALGLSVFASFAASLGGSVALPIAGKIKQDYWDAPTTNLKRKFKLRQLRKALERIHGEIFSETKLTSRISTSTQSVANFINGPFRKYLASEKNILIKKRDDLSAQIGKLQAAKSKPVLFKDSTPAEQRERLLTKFDAAIAKLEAARTKLDSDGIGLIDKLLREIPLYLGRISEWETDRGEINELVELEALASIGEAKADEAQIMLAQTQERLQSLAREFQTMISDANSAHQASLEVERLALTQNPK